MALPFRWNIRSRKAQPQMHSSNRKRRLYLFGIPLIILFIGVSSLLAFHQPEKHQTSPITQSGSANLNNAAPILWDYFQRSDRPLKGDATPSGTAYVAAGPVAPVIRSNRYIRADSSGYGAKGHSILMWPHSTAPTIVSAQYVFTAGTTTSQGAVIGSCVKNLGHGSVQFAVKPTHWEMFTVIPRDTPDQYGNVVTYTVLGKGTFSPALKTDGQTVYTTTITYNAANSSITVNWPNNQTQTFTSADPVTGINVNWGTFAFAQIVHGLPTDGEAMYAGFGSN